MKRSKQQELNRRTTASKPGHKNCGAAPHSPDTTEGVEGTHRQDRAMRTGTSPPNKGSDRNNATATKPTTSEVGKEARADWLTYTQRR
jgi:hypothetical protein